MLKGSKVLPVGTSRVSLINGLPCLEGVSLLFVGSPPAPRTINNSIPQLDGALGSVAAKSRSL